VFREYTRKYRQAHREACNERSRQYLRSRPDQVAAYARARRARKAAAEGSHTAEDIKALWERQEHRCAVPGCRNPISDRGRNKYHVDHIVPLNRRGSNGPENLQILCARHNLEKHDADPYEWAKTHGRLFI